MTRIPLPAGLRLRPIAHRALHDRAQGIIENSPSAIRAAIDHGYAIEIDLQLSADGQAMVFHDEELDRLTAEAGPVHARSATELGRIALTGSTDTIRPLPEILALIAGRAPLLIEVKDQTLTMSETDGRLEAATAAALADYRGEVALMSFNPHSITRLAKSSPQIARGLTTSAYDHADWAPLDPATCDRLREIPDYDRSASSFISHEAADLARPRVAELAAAGAEILCWTIKSPQAEAEARRHARNITFEGYLAALDG